MEVKQIYELMNDVTKEIVGDSVILNEDLTNITDIGTAIFDATAVDNYVKSLLNHIGKVIFVNRPYSGSIPSVLRLGWEFGSVLEKISAELPEATENESWELENGTSYDPNIFYKPTVTAKFYNKKATFEIPMSFTEMQVKESFSNAEQLNGFLSMLYNAVDKSMTVKMDAIVTRTINNMIGETIHADYPNGNYSATSGVKAVNLLKLYNDKFGTQLTATDSITNPEFNRFASYMIGVYMDRMAKISKLFNVEGKDRFTPTDMLHVVMLSDFAKASDVYLQSNVFHDELTKLPMADTIPYFQGSGTSYDFADISKINVKTASGNTVEVSGILAVLFDHDAVAICNTDRHVTTSFNPKAEFYSNWYKATVESVADTSENFVVFFVA